MKTLETIKVSATKEVSIKADNIGLYYVVLTQDYNGESDVLRNKCYANLKSAQRFATTLRNRG